MNIKEKVYKFIDIAIEMANIDLWIDGQAIKYNQLFDKADKLLINIIEEDNFKDLINLILEKTDGNKYWMVHCNLMAGIITKRDKELALKILKLHKWSEYIDARIKKFEEYLVKEGSH